ncbi:FAD-dependent oxidoreductase [Conexibacter woesei]|uniref:FAD-dependent oxidoreductase n=1 Tax=Conexibacter woesei TaxID=191495 RepID=UPI0004041A33|nr:cyclic nucleotide-binding domain-containing thioredoxin-disulfide reductase [Conexibacter woesei]
MSAHAASATSLPETPDHDGAYPRLDDEQLARLAPAGRTRTTRAGDVLFREGDEDYDFVVVLEGRVAIVQGEGDDERLIAVHGPRRFLGELGLLTGQPAFFSAVVHRAGSVLEVPVERLRDLATRDSALGDLILRAYLIRRELLIGLGAGLKIVGSRYSPRARELRDVCARNRVPHRWIDLEEDASAEDLLQRLGVSPQETPVVIWHGEVLRNPTPGELAGAIGLPDLPTAVEVCDLVVVGAGPAGLAAAVYGASEGLATVALDAVATGGQAATSSRIENYLGFPAGLSGAELAERATIQARKFGARLAVPATAVALDRSGGRYVIRLASGQALETRAVVIATGARYRKLEVPRLEDFESNSVYYAATLVEAQWCAGAPVVVVGGGNSAGQATTFLARHATEVHLVLREDDLEVNMSRYLADRIRALPNVRVHRHLEVRELLGDHRLEAVVVEDRHSGARSRLDAEALFVFIGAEPHTEWLRGVVALDEGGYVITGAEGEEDGRRALLLETNRPGVLAVGDVRSGSIKRVASAVGEGSMAVRLVHEHLGTLR